MTRKRNLALVAAFAALICLALAVTAQLPRPGIPKARFDGIKKGMTKNEVEDILGRPGFDFPWAGVRTFAWHVDDGGLEAFYFDRNGRMEWQFSYGPRQETIPEKILRWLHLD